MNKQITVVDARMGRGKSSAAIRYMNDHPDRRFLYVTPYLKEVDRICEACDFEAADSDMHSKSVELKQQLRRGTNTAVTHALFYLMDSEALDIVATMGYSLIIDESIQCIDRPPLSSDDFRLITKILTTEDDNGRLIWVEPGYTGKFENFKAMAEQGSLLRLDKVLVNMLNPKMLEAFDEVFMLTYLFDGQYQKGYLEFFNIPYHIVGVEQDEKGYYFSDKPDCPPPIDYSSLIHIYDKRKYLYVGDSRYALSKNWYLKRGYEDPEMEVLRTGMRNFLRTKSGDVAARMLWTSYKDDKDKLIDNKYRRYNRSFLQVSSRATNEYRDRDVLAYMVNRFADPNITKLFATRNITINLEQFALSEMLQWIWRGAIRDDKPIDLYVPSERMRELLKDWIKVAQKGGVLHV